VYQELVSDSNHLLLLTGSRYIFLRFAAKKTRTDGAAVFVTSWFPSPYVRVRNEVECIENLLKRITLLHVTHRFSIHFSPRCCEKNSNWRCRSVCHQLISVAVCSSAKRSEVYRELVEKDYAFACYSPVLDTFFSALLRKKLELTGPQCFSGIDFCRRLFECETKWSVSRTCWKNETELLNSKVDTA